MSEVRQTELLEGIYGSGWTSEKVTAGSAETKTVKATAGRVAMLYVTSAVDVTLKDNTTDKWEAVNDTTQDWSACPIQCNTSIQLAFGGAADAWIVYK